MQAVITSRQNSRVRALRAALSERRSTDLIAVEGVHLLREAMHAVALGHPLEIDTVFLQEDRHALAGELHLTAETVLLSKEVFASVAATEATQGVAFLMHRPRNTYRAAHGDLLLVAAALQDPGNLGTLIRSAEAFGAAAVLLTEETVDPWNGKALRASTGSTFRVPVVPWTEALHEQLRSLDLHLLAAVPSMDAAESAFSADLRSGCAIVIGNEGKGVPEKFLSLCDGRITLPMAGPTESLNAAVAGSLLLYEAFRQRSGKSRSEAPATL